MTPLDFGNFSGAMLLKTSRGEGRITYHLLAWGNIYNIPFLEQHHVFWLGFQVFNRWIHWIEPLSSSSCDVGICGEHGMRLHYFITPPFELQKKRHLKLHVIALPPSYQWYQADFSHLNYTWQVLESIMFSFGSVLKEQWRFQFGVVFFSTVCPQREQSNRAGAFTTSALTNSQTRETKTLHVNEEKRNSTP